MKVFKVQGNGFFPLNIAADSALEAMQAVLLRDTQGQYPILHVASLEACPEMQNASVATFFQELQEGESLFMVGQFKVVMSGKEI